MERQIPDVWNIFSLSGPDYSQQQQRRTAAAASSTADANYPYFHVNWSNHNQDLLHKWCDRSSPCDRPRTYDKFYHKLPGNFVDNKAAKGGKYLCSSDAEEHDLELHANCANTNDCQNNGTTVGSGSNRKKKRRKKSERNYSRTITEREVRHLDRHLSMKKTIRKKIMRDLQQAFVDKDEPTPETFDRVNFDPKNKATNDSKLLDLLKCDDPADSGHGTDPGPSPSHSDHHRASSKSVRDRNQQQRYLISDSSSCGGYESAESEKDIVILASEQIHALELQPRQQQRRSTAQHQQQEHHVSPTSMTSSSAGGATTTSTSIYSSTNMEPSKSSSSTTKKKSFWQLLTGKKSSKKCVS